MVSGLFFVASYIPQIIAVARCPHGARSTSLCTWALWTCSSAVGLAYGLLVVKNMPFVLVNVGSFVGCAVIWTTAAAKRRRMPRLPAPTP